MQKHQIPVSAIPCLSYKRALEEEKRLIENKNNNLANEDTTEKTATEKTESTSGCPYANGEKSHENGEEAGQNAGQEVTSSDQNTDDTPPTKKPRVIGAFSNAKIETVHENLKDQSLTVQQINDYCNKLFVFRNIRVMRFT